MTGRRPSHFGLFLASLALMVQFGLVITLPRANLDASLASVATICHADDDAANGSAPAPTHHPDCAICPLCATLAGVASLLPSHGSVLPTPSTVFVASAVILPPSTAPPVEPRFATQPRAPPLQA